MEMTKTHIKQKLYIGIDVDSKSFAITFQDDSKKGKSLKMPASSEQLYSYFQKHHPDQEHVYVYEAGGTGFSLHDYLVSLNQQCMMIHPPSLKKAANDRVKNNRIDSQKLSDQLRSGELKGIRVPSQLYRDLRHLVDLRQQNVRSSTKTKQRIKALLLFENVQLPDIEHTKHWSNLYIKILHSQISKMKVIAGLKLKAYLDELEHNRKQVLWATRELRKFCSQHEEIHKNMQYLRSIPGIGFVVASYLLARIGDPKNLQKANEIGAFAGVVPSEHSTGDEITRGPITHMGDSTMRSLLVEASWIAIKKDAQLGQFFHRIKKKHPPRHGSRIAIVAVARKLTQRVYRVLKEQREYVVH